MDDCAGDDAGTENWLEERLIVATMSVVSRRAELSSGIKRRMCEGDVRVELDMVWSLESAEPARLDAPAEWAPGYDWSVQASSLSCNAEAAA